MYWHHIVNLKPDSLLNKFYKAQVNQPVKGNWINLLIKDKSEFELNYTDEDLKSISKLSFKNTIKKKANKLAIEYLKKLKAKHSKTKNIEINENKIETAEYLKDKRIHPKDAKFIFKMRTRMYNVKCNFKNQYGDNLVCNLCKMEEESQEHLLQCKVLKTFVPEISEQDLKYESIFGDIEDVIKVSKLLYKVTKEREKLLILNEATE